MSYNIPILLIVFNRPNVTRKVFEAVKRMKPQKLYIAADGPRANKQQDVILCRETRKIFDEIDWECDIVKKFSQVNIGSDNGPLQAIDWFFDCEEVGIVLEDDCLASESFFYYCQALLERYKDDKDIMMISGNNFQDGKIYGNFDYYYSKYGTTWGWASWRRAWALPGIEKFTNDQVREAIKKSFSDKRQSNYWYGFYKKLVDGKYNFWDTKWELRIILNNGLSITPNTNLVQNIGFDADATHTAGGSQKLSIATGMMRISAFNDIREVCVEADNHLFYRNYYSTILDKVLIRIRKYFNA